MVDSGESPKIRRSRLPAFVLTPDDIDSAQFNTILGHYSAKEVDAFMERVKASLAWLEKTSDFRDPSTLFADHQATPVKNSRIPRSNGRPINPFIR